MYKRTEGHGLIDSARCLDQEYICVMLLRNIHVYLLCFSLHLQITNKPHFKHFQWAQGIKSGTTEAAAWATPRNTFHGHAQLFATQQTMHIFAMPQQQQGAKSWWQLLGKVFTTPRRLAVFSLAVSPFLSVESWAYTLHIRKTTKLCNTIWNAFERQVNLVKCHSGKHEATPAPVPARTRTRTTKYGLWTMAPASEQNTWVGALIKSQIFHAMRQAFAEVLGGGGRVEGLKRERGVGCNYFNSRQLLSACKCSAANPHNRRQRRRRRRRHLPANFTPPTNFSVRKSGKRGQSQADPQLGSWLACLCTCSHFEFG